MADQMTYPKNPMDFIKGYSFRDKEEVYTNGAELIPVFRVEQMIEHYMPHRTHKHTYENCHNLTCRRKCEQDGYNRAIDEFAEVIKTSQDAHIWCCEDSHLEFCIGYNCDVCLREFEERINEMAKQMKGE